MGVLKNGPFGGFTGKVNNLVGYEVNGQFRIRARPKERTTPPTAGELENRKKFDMVQAWLRPLTLFLRTGFQHYKPTFEGFTAAKSYLMKNALVGEKPNEVIDPSKVLVSFGRLPLPQQARAELSGAREITISWSATERQPLDIRSMYVIYIPGGHPFAETAGPVYSKGEVKVSFPDGFTGKALVYLAFVREDRKDRSNSVFLGEITIPKAKRAKAAKR